MKRRLYDSVRWRKARARFLRAHPLCAMCEERGVTEAADLVDHRIPHMGDPALFWDEENWQSLSKRCHDSRKQMLESNRRIAPHRSWGGGPLKDGDDPDSPRAKPRSP
jgi:5-methylcytosine-specific restriction endonuclease McrA